MAALQTVISIGLVLIAERIFVSVTHANQMTIPAHAPAEIAAKLHAANHALLITSMMIGAVTAMLSTMLGGAFPTARAQLKMFIVMPVPIIAGLAAGLSLSHHRVPSLILLIVILASSGYARRFGAWGILVTMLAFIGDFLGYFLGVAAKFSQIGWFAAEVCIGVAVAALVHFAVFRPTRAYRLRWLLRSFAGRGRRVVSTALDVLDDGPRDRHSRRLHRALVRFNETALMADATLNEPGVLPDGVSATALHQVIFDGELALGNMARFAERLTDFNISSGTKDLVRNVLTTANAGQVTQTSVLVDQLQERMRSADDDFADAATGETRTKHIVLHRFVTSANDWATVMARSTSNRPGVGTAAGSATETEEKFTPAVGLIGGWLPGAAMVSARAATEPGPHWWDRVVLAPNLRATIQLGVAVTCAVIFGSMLSERRFYWAVIAAFITFMGANSATEQMRKGTLRVFGTVVGVFVGAALAHLVGHRTTIAIVVIMIALFFGIYLMRISYAFMTIGMTVTVSQLYVQLGEFSDSLLRLRLEETAIGAGVAILTILIVVPIRTGQVVRIALRSYVAALRGFIEDSQSRLRNGDDMSGLRQRARELDSAHQTLTSSVSSSRPIIPGVGTQLSRRILASADASRHYARNLLIDLSPRAALGSEVRADLATASDQMVRSMAEIETALTDQNVAEGRTFVRSASLFDAVAIQKWADLREPTLLALRDIELIDGSMATLAKDLGMQTLSLDVDDALETSGARHSRPTAERI